MVAKPRGSSNLASLLYALDGRTEAILMGR
jgi:hypothetical protein